MNNYDIGDEIQVSASFYAGSPAVLVDPSTVRLKVKSARSVAITYTYLTDDNIVRVSEGVYQALIIPDSSGRWTYRWEGTENPKTASEVDFFVRPSAFA